MTLTHTIPVLDLQDFQTGRRDRFVEQVGQALESIGFFALVNHGVDEDLIQRAYQAAADFFQLPESVKRRYEDPALNGQRGWQRTCEGQSLPRLEGVLACGAEVWRS